MPFAKLIVNPAAGAGKTAKRWPQIKSYLEKMGLRYEHVLTEAPGHAVTLAADAVKKGYELIVSVGGDGTINEVVNGLYQSGSLKDVTLGIIGTGTGSDYIRTIGIPQKPEDACLRLPDSVKRTLDLGCVEYNNGGSPVKRLFVNFAGCGFDAEVARATKKNFKALGSVPSYLAGLFSTFLTYQGSKVSLKIDGEENSGRIFAVIVSNGKYGGGKMKVAPDADPGDGFFDVVRIGDLDKLDLLSSLPRIYRGTHTTHPKVSIKRAREIEIHSVQKMPLQADGELLGETPARFSILPQALNIIV